MDPTTSSTALPPGRLAACFGFGVAGLAVWVFPLVLGPVAVLLGLIAHRRGERLGRWVVLAGVVGLCLGLVIDALPDSFVSG